MIDLKRTLCFCNRVKAGEIVEYIKSHNITTLDHLVDRDDFPLGNACESCRTEGFDDDGFSLQMLLDAIQDRKL